MKIVAHRGHSACFAENSVAAFEAAIAARADFIETDVRMSADAIPVCWHDPDLRRVAGSERPIAQTSAAELAAIDLPGGAHIHRLSEVLALAHGRIAVMLDVKLDDDDGRRAIMQALSAADMTAHTIYGVRTPEHARALHMLDARCRRLAMPAEPTGLAAFPLEHFMGVRLWEDQVDAPAIERIRSHGLAVWVTAGIRSAGEAPGYIDAERLQRLRALGVDAILVNDVSLARAHTASGASGR